MTGDMAAVFAALILAIAVVAGTAAAVDALDLEYTLVGWLMIAGAVAAALAAVVALLRRRD